MAIGEAGLDLVKSFEGLVLEAYRDPVGVWTIGWGHTGPDVGPGSKITLEEAEAFLRSDLEKHAGFVDSRVTVPINANQRAALVSLAFNVGSGNLGSSTLMKKLNRGDVAAAAEEFGRWVHGTVDGVKTVLPGLVRRRRAERELFESAGISVTTSAAFHGTAGGDPPAAAPTALEREPIPLSALGGRRDMVVAVQRALCDLGYLDPPADGRLGPVTLWALEQFCAANGLRAEAGLTGRTVEALHSARAGLPRIASSGTWFDRVIAYMLGKGYWICRHRQCWNIVYLEGVNRDGTLNDNKPNAFNDLRVVFSLDSRGFPRVLGWQATCEPGTAWTMAPTNAGGAARIAFGQYKAWVVGTHPRNGPSAHEALIQVEPVAVHRDLNRDHRRQGDRLDVGLFGINQHWGYDAPRSNVGTASAGCLVGRSRHGHREFMSIVKSDPRFGASPGYRFMTAVLPGAEVLRR